MDSIYDPAEVYDAELLNDDDDNDDTKSDQDKGESDRIDDDDDDEAMAPEDSSASVNIIVDDVAADKAGDTVAVEEDTDGNKERFSRTEGENKKVSVMQRLSPSIDSGASRDSARRAKGNYSRLMVLNLPLSCSVDQLKEFINSKLDSGVTLDKLEGIYVGAAMVWITPVSAIGTVASSLQDCILDDRKVVARKMSSRDYDVFAKKKSKALKEPKSLNRDGRGSGSTEVFWRVAIRNINTSLSSDQLENIFKKRAGGVFKVYMIVDKTVGSGKKHSGRGYVTMQSRDMAAIFCRKVGNSIIGGRNVVARLESRPMKSPVKKSPAPAHTTPRPAPRPPHYRLTVTGVSVEVSAKELEEIFSSEVSSAVRAHLAPMAGAPHAGTGYLEFRKEESALTAHTLLNGTDIGGSCITLTLDIDKGSEPVDQEEATGESSEVMEVAEVTEETEDKPQQKEPPITVEQRSRSRDPDSRRERNRREERGHREPPERERRNLDRDRRRAKDNDRSARARSRSPLRAERGESRRFDGVTIFRDIDELRRKTRGSRYRAHVSNISYNVTDGMMINLVNQHVSGLKFILSVQGKDGKFKGVMILEFISPAATENFIDKMVSFNINDRRIVIKMDTDNSLRDEKDGERPRRSSPMFSRGDRIRQRDPSPMRLPQHMGGHSHMGPDQMLHPGMQMGGTPMQNPMGHSSQMGGMNQMMPGMGQGINPALAMASGQQLAGPVLGLGQQMAGGFGMNRGISGVMTRLGDVVLQSGPMGQNAGFMPSQQQPQQQQLPVVESTQRQMVALPTTTGVASTETFGLSTAFLASLNIKLPLVKELLVTNLDGAATEADLKDLFAIAGTVVKIQYNSVKGQAVVEMGHPVEAVQAVSMLHNQEYFDKTLGVRMLRPNDPDNLVTRDVVPAVPRGLKTIGKGLGIDGLPLSTVLQQAIAPQQQQPQQSVIPDPCMQRPPPPNKGSAEQPMFAFPPPPQLPPTTFPRRGQGSAANTRDKGGQGGSQSSSLSDTSRRAERHTERASRWESSYQKTPATNADTWGTRRDSGAVGRIRQDGPNTSKSRFNNSGGGEGYSQPSADRMTDMSQRYGSVDSKSNGSTRERNDSRGTNFNQEFGGGGRRDDQFNQASNSWLNDRTALQSSSYGNQSETARFSNNASSNGRGEQERASRVGSSWDDAGHSRADKPPNSYGTDERNRAYSSNDQNRNYGFNRSGGFPSAGGDALNASESTSSAGSANLAKRGRGGQGSSLLGGFRGGGRGGGFGSESATGPPTTSPRSSLGNMMPSSTVGREVILSNLPSNAKQQTIVDMCMPYGVVRNVTLNNAQRTGRVVFDSYQQATMAADILNNQNYNGAILAAMLA